MINQSELASLLKAFILDLERPLGSSEIANGWTSKAQQATLHLTRDIHTKLLAGEPLPDVSLSRGLDSWGVQSGDMCEAAAKLSNAIRQYSSEQKSGRADR